MTKHTRYYAKLQGKPGLVSLVADYIQANGLSLGEYRKLRRAVEDIFGNDLRLDIIGTARQVVARAKRL